uniref:Uncharacterized protein n=1 Tax=Anguilla anguilla TaxID=7936 RepID=A0A0E9PFL8_ANGAN
MVLQARFCVLSSLLAWSVVRGVCQIGTAYSSAGRT